MQDFIKILLSILLITPSVFGQTTIIETGGNWKYYNQGNIHNSGWPNSNYNDFFWSERPTKIGYGVGDEATTISYGSDVDNKYISTYFRKSFNLISPRDIQCSIKKEEGAVIYLNGTEVYRVNMPSGTIDFNTLAIIEDTPGSWYSFTIPANYTLSGNNVLSIEMHLDSPKDPSLSFDFIANAPLPPPPTGVYINEIMASNNASFLTVGGQSSDWIEIFNNTTQDLDLANYYLSDNKSNKTKFRFTSQLNQVVVPAGEYKIIWASGTVANGFDHTSWSLSANGEHVSLTMPNGTTIVDSLTFPQQKTDVSYGRLYSKIDSIVYFYPSTPNLQNNAINAYLGFLPSPTFSSSGGIFVIPFNLSITNNAPGATVTYSKDSSEPSIDNLEGISYPLKNFYPQIEGETPFPMEYRAYKSFQYFAPILIENPENKPNSISEISSDNSGGPYIPQINLPKANIIRARAEKSGYLPSDIVTGSYFFTPNGISNYTLPIYSLNTQESFLYDYFDGISTAGYQYDYDFELYGRIQESGNFGLKGKQWERKANIEVFSSTATTINENIDLRIHGKLSRQFLKKSFRLYFDTGKNLFEYSPPKLSSKIILRNPRIFQTHDVATNISKGLNFEYQDNKPNILYLNGEYWGIYTITDFIDEDYLAKKFNLNSSNIDIIKDDILDAGSDLAYINMLTFLENNDFSQQNNYDSLTTLIDIDNFNDYIITEIFLNNTDWPNNNTLVWRNQTQTTFGSAISPSDGRWRWLLLDLDGTLVAENDTTINSVYGGQHLGMVFAKLLSNENYKHIFLNRYADLAGSHFNPSRTVPITQSTINKYAPEMALESSRWDYTSVENWNIHMSGISYFLNERNNALYGQFLNRFEIEDTFELTVSTNDINRGYIKVNTINILPSTDGLPQNPSQWTGKYFKGIPIKITAKHLPCNKFLYWIHNGNTIYDSSIVVNAFENESFEAYFEELLLSNNPVPSSFNLQLCSYKFDSWSATSANGSSPNNMKFVYFETLDPLLNEKIVGYPAGAYNFTSKTRINGLGAAGVAFINTNSTTTLNEGYTNGKLGGVLLAINTIGIDSVKINWTGKTVTVGTRKYALRLQYREGDQKPFQDFNPVVSYNGATAVGNNTYTNILLPQSMVNKPYVQLLWRYYYTGIGESGSRDQLAIDDIEIKTVKIINTDLVSTNQILKNTSFYKFNNNIDNLSSLKSTAQYSIVLQPGFKVENGGVFEAKIGGCVN